MSTLPFRSDEVIDAKYTIGEVLGMDAVSVVYAATHVELGHGVAIRALRSEAKDDNALRARFLRQARDAARLRSGHVAKIFDVAIDPNDIPYIVMDRLVGHDLHTILERRGPLAERCAVDLLVQACTALAEAHESGIVHRDLRPEHLILERRRDGRTKWKVADVGIAKAAPETAPYFAAPEQLRSASDGTAASDVWALGAILYRALTNAYPFAGTASQVRQSILFDAPMPLARRRRDLSPALCAIVARCLEKDPTRRYAHAGAMLEALSRVSAAPRGDALAVTRPPSATNEPSPRRSTPSARTPLELVAMAAIALLVCVVGWRLRHAFRPHDEPVLFASTFTPAAEATAITRVAIQPLPPARPNVEHRARAPRAKSRPVGINR